MAFMSETWNFKGNDNQGNKLEYATLAEGITKIRILDDAPVVYFAHWSPSDKRFINCPGMNDCPICALRKVQKEQGLDFTFGTSRKIAIRVWNYNTERIEILEKGVTFFDDLHLLMQDLAEEGVPLQDAIIKIRRTGTGKDNTKYRIDLDSKSPIEDTVYDKLKETPLIKDQVKPHTVEFIKRVLDGEAMKDIYESMKSANNGNTTEDEVVLK